MKRKTLFVAIAVLLLGAAVVWFFMPQENEPSPESRIVLEHTHRTFIAPSCFDDSDPTNFLEESTLGRAQELNYPPHSECTEQAFESNQDSPAVRLLKELGLMEKTQIDW
ncbi:hypothetical protein [Planococcus sp. ISL-109]|uniref:hypothetical protein n=1 Tax=Planococcus sp. ISL-109 TaxID=2819166 RepID=UPI001BE55866|nr:hypothetical protein [Planococcus sp. ISL-109]MBT2581443.1 hypothetical protein [Planococcus sp. ISL-109]